MQIMNHDKMNSKDLDRIMQQVFETNTDFLVPDRLVAEVIRKQEKRMLFRELMLELAFKTGLVIGSIAVLVGVFAIASNLEIIRRFYVWAIENKELVVLLISSAGLIAFVDQVVLRLYNDEAAPRY
jgi:hypothetical protein